jgi:hypothetical protein
MHKDMLSVPITFQNRLYQYIMYLNYIFDQSIDTDSVRKDFSALAQFDKSIIAID